MNFFNKKIFNIKANTLYSYTYKSISNFQVIANKFNLNQIGTTKSVIDRYDDFSYETEIQPTYYKYSKVFPRLSDFNLKVAFVKKHDFFLPSKNDHFIQTLTEIKNYLSENTNLTDAEITEIVFCCPKVAEEYAPQVVKNLKYLFEFLNVNPKKNDLKILKDYPSLLLINEINVNKLIETFYVYLNGKGSVVSKNKIKQFMIDNPLLVTLNNNDLYLFLDAANTILNDAKTMCENNISVAEFKRKVDKEDLSRIKKLGDKLNEKIHLPVEEEILKLSLFDFLKYNPYMLCTSANNFKQLFSIFDEKLGIKPFTTLNIIRRCPDVVFCNRHKLLEKKIDLLLNMEMSKYVIRHLFKYYPFMITKSFNSYIKKYDFLKNDCKYKLKEDLEIYPLILIFDFETEIKPKLSLLKLIEQAIELKKAKELLASFSASADDDKILKYSNYKVISPRKAFTLSKTQFCKEIGMKVEDYDDLYKKTESDKPDLHERDLLFYYSKFKYIHP